MTPPFSVEECADGTLQVIDMRDRLIMAHFRRDMREFAEEMRDRLNVRALTQAAR